MRHPVTVVFAVAGLLTSFMGCGGRPSTASPNDVVEQYTAHLGKIADALETVQSQDQAEVAAGQISQLTRNSSALTERFSAAGSRDEELDSATQQALRQQSERVGNAIDRLQAANLLTPALNQALREARQTQDTLIATAKAGALPAPQSPLEQAYFDLIEQQNELVDVSSNIRDLPSAQRAIPKLTELRQREYAIEQRLADLGAEHPPVGIPQKYAEPYRLVRQRVNEQDEALSQLPQEVVQTLIATVLREMGPDPFALDAEIRRHGRERIATVVLRNNQVLQGTMHQQLIEMLKRQSGANSLQSVIDDDGTYRVVLAPVSDFATFARSIGWGTVSDVDPQARTLTLTVDPGQVPPEETAQTGSPGGAPPGFIPSAATPAGSGVAGGLSQPVQQRLDHERQHMASQFGADGVIVVYAKNARPFLGQRFTHVLGRLKEVAEMKMFRIVPAESGDVLLVVASTADVQVVATQLDVGDVESVDATGRQIVVRLSEDKIP